MSTDQSKRMLSIPVNDKSSALDLMFGFLHLAQSRGAFNFPESAKIYECIQQFNDFFGEPEEELEEKEDDPPLPPLQTEELGNFEDDAENDTQTNSE